MTELRMDAYYYGFEPTGVPEIDLILSAVACAGKSFHLTEDWCEEIGPRTGHTGEAPVDWIQNAANAAAERIRAELRIKALGRWFLDRRDWLTSHSKTRWVLSLPAVCSSCGLPLDNTKRRMLRNICSQCNIGWGD